MDKELFQFDVEETNGEQEHTSTCYVWAKDINEAEELAHDYVSNWYEDESNNEYRPNHFENDFAFWELTDVKKFDTLYLHVINGDTLHFGLESAIIE